jgi:hypothetical protein
MQWVTSTANGFEFVGPTNISVLLIKTNEFTYVEKLTVALGQNAWEAHVTSIDCLFKAGFADLAGT